MTLLWAFSLSVPLASLDQRWDSPGCLSTDVIAQSIHRYRVTHPVHPVAVPTPRLGACTRQGESRQRCPACSEAAWPRCVDYAVRGSHKGYPRSYSTGTSLPILPV